MSARAHRVDVRHGIVDFLSRGSRRGTNHLEAWPKIELKMHSFSRRGRAIVTMHTRREMSPQLFVSCG